MAKAATTPEKPRVAPTDRSIPPEMTTNVSPMAMRTTGAQSSRTLEKTSLLKKIESRLVKYATTAT